MDHGVHATSFATVETFNSALADGRFRAFVLEWSIGGGESGEPQTAEPALAKIRALERSRPALPAGSIAEPTVPIFITTGTLDGPDGSAVERVLIQTSARYKAQIILKPMRASLLAADIKRGLGVP